MIEAFTEIYVKSPARSSSRLDTLVYLATRTTFGRDHHASDSGKKFGQRGRRDDERIEREVGVDVPLHLTGSSRLENSRPPPHNTGVALNAHGASRSTTDCSLYTGNVPTSKAARRAARAAAA